MLPLIYNPNTIPVPATLVATALPGTSTLRVPHNNVAPSLSSVQIGNNARGNGGTIALSQTPPAVDTLAAGGGTFLSAGGPGAVGAGASTAFLAQLLGQDFSPAVRGILVEYEKLVALSQVKYKPSNATLPLPEPSSVFGRILHQEQAARPAPQVIPDLPRTAVSSAAETVIASTAVSIPVLRAATGPLRAAKTEDAPAPAPEESDAAGVDAAPALPAPPTIPRAALIAYAIGSLRNLLTEPPAVAESA